MKKLMEVKYGGTNPLLNKKGFTLIELLAVIVILAIILIIAVPMVLNVINTARYGAFGVSKKNIERAAELYYLSNSNKVNFDGNIAYIEIGELKERGYISKSIAKILDQEEISDEIKVLVYKRDKNIEYHLQMYDESFLKWYQLEMIKGAKKEGSTPSNVGDKIQIGLVDLMTEKRVSELRIPSNLSERCEGYVEVEKTANDKYEYKAYVDCLEEASTFASHYVSYGGKYIDEFNDVKETSDGGYIAAGRSNSEVITKYGTGNNGKYDAIIVKFDSEGNVEWSDNFGGSNTDSFNAVAEVQDGYIAVGSTYSNDFDIEDYKGGENDALIVKYDKQGEVVYKRSYGGSGKGSSSGSESFTGIYLNNNNYIIYGIVNLAILDGDHEGMTFTGDYKQYIILEFDNNFNILKRKIISCDGYSSPNKLEKTDGGYLMITTHGGSNHKGLIAKLDQDFNMVKSKLFIGIGKNNRTYFSSGLEVNDGYIVVGYSFASEQDMEGLSKADNGYSDAIIIKYDKNLENIIWKKSFGGSNDDVFYSLVKMNDNTVIVTGYSKSTDMDMNDLNNLDGYSKSIMVKYNTNNGAMIESQVFGGSNSDAFNKIIKTSNNKYIIAGNTYSKEGDLENFNKGHSDAILVSYDRNLELEKTFQEPVVLIDVLKEMVPSYGTSVNLKYDNIYTSNDPTKDLLGWCSTGEPNGNNNYGYGECLRPFNNDELKLLTNIEATATSHKRVYAGENEYLIDNEPNNYKNWHQIFFQHQNTGASELSNFKIKFNDNQIFSIKEAIDNKYIEPLVIVSNRLLPTIDHSKAVPNAINIINLGGSIGIGESVQLYVNFKPIKKVKSVIFTSSKDIHPSVGFSVYELRNFDMSIIPTN